MAQSAREKWSRRSWLLAGLTIPLFTTARAAAQALNVTFDGDNLRVAAPQLHFLAGKPLQRLQDGSALVFLSQITLFRSQDVVWRRALERMTVSYDVWEEKFKVVMAVDRRSASGLSLAAAENWCLDNLAISALGLEPSRPFWLRFDLRLAEEKDLSALVGDPGISLRNWIEFFSRKSAGSQAPWSFTAGPLRLADLPRISARGTRG